MTIRRAIRAARQCRFAAMRALLALCLSVVALGAFGLGGDVARANGDDPTPTPTVASTDPDPVVGNAKVDHNDKIGEQYIRGPWLPIKQLFWVSSPNGRYLKRDDDPYNIGGDNDNHKMGSLMDRRYVPIKHDECYPDADGKGPDGDETNSIYLMMSCRLGKVVGVMTWTAVGVGILSLAWGAMMYVSDSGSGGERAGQLKQMVSGPVVGIFICLFAYVFAYVAYGALNFAFTRYLYELTRWVPGIGA